jgi:hypothetical protein
MCNTMRAIEKLLNIALLLLLPMLRTPDTIAGEADRSSKGKLATKADFVLAVKDNLISLEAKNASLKEILEEIGRKMNIEVLALLPEQEKLTTEFENVPLEEAIERLLRNYPHLAVSQEGDRRITRIVALQKSGDLVPSTPVMKETETKKQEIPVKLESPLKEQPVRKESPPPEPFKFQFDPTQYGQKRR